MSVTNRGPLNSWGKKIGKRSANICEWCWEHEEMGDHVRICANITQFAGEESEEVEVEEEEEKSKKKGKNLKTKQGKKGKRKKKERRPREAFYEWVYSRFLKKFFCEETEEVKEAGRGLEMERLRTKPWGEYKVKEVTRRK